MHNVNEYIIYKAADILFDESLLYTPEHLANAMLDPHHISNVHREFDRIGLNGEVNQSFMRHYVETLSGYFETQNILEVAEDKRATLQSLYNHFLKTLGAAQY